MDLPDKEGPMGRIEVLVPVADVTAKEIMMAQRPLDLDGKTIGFLWNRKPNGDLLLRYLEGALKKKYPLHGTWMREKPVSSSQAPSEILEDLSANCDLVILAVGD
jgi:hypothetical protein